MKPHHRKVLILVSLTLLTLLVAASTSMLPNNGLTARIGANLAENQEASTRLRAQLWFERGQQAAAQGDLLAAASAWQISLQYGAPPAAVYPRLVDAHRRLGDNHKIKKDLAVLVSIYPSDPSWLYQLGLVELALQEEEARFHLSRAAKLDPTLAQDVRLLERGLSSTLISKDPAFQLVASGRALASIGEWELAGFAFEKATRLNPNYAEAWAFLGEARRQTGLDGLQELQKAVHLDSQSLLANTLLGLYWQQSGRLDLALVYLDAAARQDPDNPVLQVAVGRVLAQRGNLQAALRRYQRAAEANPRDPAHWRTLANFTVEFETGFKEIGLPAARTAVLLDSADPASLDTLARVYILLGQPLIARRFITRALAADPGYAPARLHLGLVDLLQGYSTEGQVQLQLAGSLSPDGSAVDEQARRLLLNIQP